jgi:hypothetical protein
MSKLFDNDVAENPVDIMKETIEVKIDEVERDGETTLEPIVSFAVNRGKGTGAQKIPLSEFAGYLETVQDFRDNGFDDAKVEGYRVAGEIVRETMSLVKPTEEYEHTDDDGKVTTKKRPIKNAEPNLVSWRTRTGKGSKPARVQREDFPSIIEILEMVPALASEQKIAQAWDKHRKAVAAKAAADQKKADEAAQKAADNE